MDCTEDKKVFCPLSTDNTLCKFCGVDLLACDKVCSRGLTRVRQLGPML
jgi:hypothetical protein